MTSSDISAPADPPIGSANGRLQLGRRSLTLLLLGVLSFPPSVIAVLYWILPPAHDHPLNVVITLQQPAAAGDEGSVIVRNSGDIELRHLRVELNRAFHYLPRNALRPEDSVSIPLTWFAKKSGHRFQPDRWPVESVRVSARLPNYERAVASGFDRTP